MSDRILVLALVLSTCFVGNGQEKHFELCVAATDPFRGKPAPLSIKAGRECKNCDALRNCTTFDGSIQIQGVTSKDSSVMEQLHFPFLTEITGHLLVFFVFTTHSLREIFPNLAVIRGRPSSLFLDYSLVIYQNQGLRYIDLPSFTTILNGGVRIEKNINLCYVDTIRWSSIMKENSKDDDLVIDSNNNDCYRGCFGKQCVAPAGHGGAGYEYCWSQGNSNNPSCQKLCDRDCGDSGCVDDENNICCHKECLGGCSKANSARHCHACSNLRHPDGTCLRNCGSEMFELEEFRCVYHCPTSHFTLESKGICVQECPAGYKAVYKQGRFRSIKDTCEKCVDQKCPRVCNTRRIDSKAALSHFKGCTIINGNLEIRIPGSAGIGKLLEENLGKIEVVKGYILVRTSVSLLSLKFLKNLRAIKPRNLYSKKYALAILDNPKLEALWPFHPNLTISNGGIMMHLNPHLCRSLIYPLVEEVLKWNRTGRPDLGKPVDISGSTNGNLVACDVANKISMTVREAGKLPPKTRCGRICALVEWSEVLIGNDYRNVLFYTISYREAPNRNITDYDYADACSADSQNVWTNKDITLEKPPDPGEKRSLKEYIEKLKPFTLYAFRVEAVVLKNEGAKSDLFFFQTREQVPSEPVGLEVNYLNSSSLNIKWEAPLFPNGIITEYVVEYKRSSYVVWTENMDFNWCERQFYTPQSGDKESGGDTDIGGEGSCVRNITCDCDKDKQELKPEKKAAIFAAEFQDRLFSTILVKNDDGDSNSTSTTAAPTTMPSSGNNSIANNNCSSDAQAPGCGPTGASPITTDVTTTPGKPTTVPTENPFKPVKRRVNGLQTSLDVHDLGHFADYTVTVCACTKVGCAKGTACAMTRGRTDKSERADDLEASLEVSIDRKFQSFNVSWVGPRRPNAVVLKYEIQITRDTNDATMHCNRGSSTWLHQARAALGNYSARVRAITPAGNGSWSQPRFFRLSAEEVQTREPSTVQAEPAPAVGMVVGASLAASIVFVLACGLVVWYIARKRYGEKQVPGVLYASVNPEYMNSADVYIPDEWEIPREQIKLTKELGNGSFGMVYEGEATNLGDTPGSYRVAVKTVSEHASTRDRLDFLQEASIMKAFACDHVVRLLGVVSEGQPTLVVMELMEHGDLKNFLRSRRPEENGMPPPTLQEMLQMSAEIADGMAYLAARKFVHRDLAARNCMVNVNFTVKIGDFGMTRDIYETDYYRKGGKGLLPVRWMGPESLKDGVFTSASDVWSYGVVLWEMATLASQPYPGKSNEEVLKHVVDGGVMEKPEDCPDQLYDLMTLCWQHNPKDRPTFIYIVSLLEGNLSERFREASFYHSLQRENLEGLLHSHYDKHRHRTGTLESSA